MVSNPMVISLLFVSLHSYNITSVGGFLRIRENAALTSLSGLFSITEIVGYVDIGSNGNGANSAPQNVRDAADNCSTC